MTFAPKSISDLAAYWVANKGINLGIVGDARHGYGYHLGKDRLQAGDYSIQRPRDRRGLTLAAAALDLGRLEGDLKHLQAFSDWLARRCVKRVKGTEDVVEVIYSPDGSHVFGYKQGVDYLIPGYGDATHLSHTHISFFRDSESRDKTALFRPYFENLPPSDTPPEVPVQSFTILPSAATGSLTIKGAGYAYLRLLDGTLHPTPPTFAKSIAFGPVKLLNPIPGGKAGADRATGYVVGDEAAFLLESDVTFKPKTTPVGDCKAAVNAALDHLTKPVTDLATAIKEARP